MALLSLTLASSLSLKSTVRNQKLILWLLLDVCLINFKTILTSSILSRKADNE